MEKSRIDIINHLADGDTLSRDEWMILLSSLNIEEREYLRAKAQEVATSNYGHGVFVRALLEISSYCRNNCYYCGIRRDNRNVHRYRLTEKQILDCCEVGYRLGFRTFVLHSLCRRYRFSDVYSQQL